MPTQYTNALTYLNARQLIDANQFGYIDTTIRYSSIFQLLPMLPSSDFMHDKFFQKKLSNTSNVQKRKLNERPQAKQKNRLELKNEYSQLYYMGTELDRKMAEYRPELMDENMAMDAEEMMMDVDYDLINGVPDETGYGMRGLKDRLTGTQLLDNGADLTINTSATTMKQFLRLFRLGVRRIKRTPGMRVVALVNETMDLAIQSGRDELGANTIGTGVFDIMNQQVTMVDNVPLVVVGTNSAGSDILPMGESNSTTSIYLMGISTEVAADSHKKPNGVCTLTTDPSQPIWTDVEQVGLQYIGHQELECGLRVPEHSAVRLQRLKAA